MLEDVLENCIRPFVEVNGLGFVDVPIGIRCKKLIVKRDRYGGIASMMISLFEMGSTGFKDPDSYEVYKLKNWVLPHDVVQSLMPHLRQLSRPQREYVLSEPSNAFDNGLYVVRLLNNIIIMNNAEFCTRTPHRLHFGITDESFDPAMLSVNDFVRPIVCVYS